MVILFSPDGKLALRSGAQDKQHKFKNRSTFFFLIPFAYSMKDTSRQQNNLSNAKYCVHVFNQGSLDREQISFLLENKALWICGLRQES